MVYGLVVLVPRIGPGVVGVPSRMLTRDTAAAVSMTTGVSGIRLLVGMVKTAPGLGSVTLKGGFIVTETPGEGRLVNPLLSVATAVRI